MRSTVKNRIGRVDASLSSHEVFQEHFGFRGHTFRSRHVSFTLHVPADSSDYVTDPSSNSARMSTDVCREQCSLLLVFQHNLVTVNFVVYLNEIVLWQIASVIYTPIIFDEVLFGHAIFDLGAVGVSVEHDNAIGENIGGI